MYIELLDKEHRGMVMKLNGSEQFIYKKGIGWVESGAFIKYTWEDSYLYDKYREISEEMAIQLISKIESEAKND